MKREELLAAAALPARILAGGALAISGYIKAIRPPQEFAAALEAYWLLPLSWVMPVARVVPWVELLTGVALLVGYGRRAAAAAGAALYAIFITFLSFALAKSLSLADCGCFGGLGPKLTPAQAIAMDSLLLILCLAVFFDRQGRWTLDRWTDRP